MAVFEASSGTAAGESNNHGCVCEASSGTAAEESNNHGCV